MTAFDQRDFRSLNSEWPAAFRISFFWETSLPQSFGDMRTADAVIGDLLAE
jgi:hypothetical protein